MGLAAEGDQLPGFAECGGDLVHDATRRARDLVLHLLAQAGQPKAVQFQTRRAGGAQSERAAIWIPAFKGGDPSPGNFLNASGISDAVTLGTVSLRAGKKVVFDSEKTRITNAADANKYLVREYRKGWEL